MEKRKINKPAYLLIAIILAFAVLFSSCVTAKEKSDTSTSGDTTTLITYDDGRPMEGNMYLEGLPIVKEKVSISVATTQEPEMGDFNEVGVFKVLEEATNVNLNFQMIPSSGASELVSLMLSTGDYPEAFIRISLLRDSTTIMKYAKSGIIVPLEDYIEKYCPNIKRTFSLYPIAKQYSTAPDGHIYSLPNICDNGKRDIRGALFINKAWLEKLGLSVPKTIDEFYQALVAFKENDCNGNGIADEIPITFNYGSATQGYPDLFGAFGVYDAVDKYSIIDGKVVYEPIREEYKNALKFMHKLYAEGLMDNETFTQDKSVWRSKFMNEKGEITIGAFVAYDPYVGAINYEIAQREFTYVPPLEGPNGHKMWRRDPAGVVDCHLFVMTDKCKHPAVLMRVIDTMNIEKWTIMGQFGMENINFEVTPEGRYRMIPQTDPEKQPDYFTTWKGPWMLTAEMWNKFIEGPGSAYRREVNEAYKPYITKYENIFPPFIFVSEEDIEQIAIIETDLSKYQERMEAQFIMEGNIDQQWDEYVNEIKKIGLDKALEIRQRAYDAYIKSIGG